MKGFLFVLLFALSTCAMSGAFVGFSIDFSGKTSMALGVDNGWFTAGVELWNVSDFSFFVGALRNVDLKDFTLTLETRVGLSIKPYFGFITFFWKRYGNTKWGFGYTILFRDSQLSLPLFIRLGW
ncbi:hypothetical protein [Thermotoga sp. SG1]|uniref:hypothetical protein n=1 Tax=Thermotoga sp. SG1 TaxID=126739 RepID=UPI000CC401E5|nr:hypothetical protein [Thermotoga sp. SG1]PLV56315.1 hypothetical protein AS006_07085 [Thermotoga sp. SG1]